MREPRSIPASGTAKRIANRERARTSDLDISSAMSRLPAHDRSERGIALRQLVTEDAEDRC
jgi:hypothetical protein